MTTTFKTTDLATSNTAWMERIKDHGLISPAETTPGDALGAIKTLREALNSTVHKGNPGWLGAVLEKLDEASDLLEFPDEAMKIKIAEVTS